MWHAQRYWMYWSFFFSSRHCQNCDLTCPWTRPKFMTMLTHSLFYLFCHPTEFMLPPQHSKFNELNHLLCKSHKSTFSDMVIKRILPRIIWIHLQFFPILIYQLGLRICFFGCILSLILPTISTSVWTHPWQYISVWNRCVLLEYCGLTS